MNYKSIDFKDMFGEYGKEEVSACCLVGRLIASTVRGAPRFLTALKGIFSWIENEDRLCLYFKYSWSLCCYEQGSIWLSIEHKRREGLEGSGVDPPRSWRLPMRGSYTHLYNIRATELPLI